MTERQQQVADIVSKPHLYKICHGCESVVYIQVKVCNICKAYRFEWDQEKVVQQAERLRDREPRSVTLDDLLG